MDTLCRHFFIYITVLVIAGMAVALGEYHYQSGPIQVMIFLCMVLRIQFRYVLPFALLAWLVQTFSLYFFLDLSDSHFTDLVSVSAFVAANSSAADRVTVSIGIGCLVPTPELSLGVLIRMADEALYQAKGAGRNRVCPSWSLEDSF